MLDAFYAFKMNMYKTFSSWGSAALTIALLLSALVIAIIALIPEHFALKAIILAYVVLP